jgi:hypothetical protein
MKATTLTKITLISICIAIGLVQVPMAQAQSSSQTSKTDPDFSNDRPSQTSQTSQGSFGSSSSSGSSGSSSSSSSSGSYGSYGSSGSSSFSSDDFNNSPTSSNFKFSLDMSSVINGILSPSHRKDEITANASVEMEKLRQNAIIEKAKITAEAGKTVDRVAPILTQWGVNRANCAPGVVFINGLSTGTVCINPTASIPAGYYNYSPDRQQLVRIETNNTQTVANVGTNIAPTPIPAPTVVKNANGATTARDRGF